MCSAVDVYQSSGFCSDLASCTNLKAFYAGVRHLAELGVVFLLFNIGLELSLERLRSMQKAVFGMGTSQVLANSHHDYYYIR